MDVAETGDAVGALTRWPEHQPAVGRLLHRLDLHTLDADDQVVGHRASALLVLVEELVAKHLVTLGVRMNGAVDDRILEPVVLRDRVEQAHEVAIGPAQYPWPRHGSFVQSRHTGRQ